MSTRRIELVRAGWGAALLIAPRTLLTEMPGVRVDRKALVVTRILGARHIVQALMSGIQPSPEVLAGGVWVDAVHSMTAFGLTVIDPRRARAVVTDGIVAGLWAGFGLRDLHLGMTPPDTSVRRRDRLARRVFGALPGGGRLMAAARRARSEVGFCRDAGDDVAVA